MAERDGARGAPAPPHGLHAERLRENPVLHPGSGPAIGDNLCGPSLIRVPGWCPRPLGRYYLYFAHHRGTSIRLAYADHLAGPWKVHEPGALRLADTVCFDHVASPDVHVDPERRQIRMYFHGPVLSQPEQASLVATSKDGVHFKAHPEVLGASYFRVFPWEGQCYALAAGGRLYRSSDGLRRFEAGPCPFPGPPSPAVRHTAVLRHGDSLEVFYSRIGDAPERILCSRIDLAGDWMTWKASEPVAVLEPRMGYEGADLPLEPSRAGMAPGRVRQLRDPAVFRDGDAAWLLYSVAGESGIAIAELRR
jgi:hypothetical protein